MSASNRNLPRLTVVIVNLGVAVMTLWFPDLPVPVKIVVTLMLVGVAFLDLPPGINALARGGVYVVMLLLGTGASVAETFLAYGITGSAAGELAATPFRQAEFAIVYAVAVGLPVMILSLGGWRFRAIGLDPDKMLAPAPQHSLRAGGVTGCSIQVVYCAAVAVVTTVLGWFLSSAAMQNIPLEVVRSFAGPVAPFVGWAFAAGQSYFSETALTPQLGRPGAWVISGALALLLMGAAMLLTFALNVKFALLSRLSKRIIDKFTT